MPQLLIQIIYLASVEANNNTESSSDFIVIGTLVSSVMSILFSGSYYFATLLKHTPNKPTHEFTIKIECALMQSHHCHAHWNISVGLQKAFEYRDPTYIVIDDASLLLKNEIRILGRVLEDIEYKNRVNRIQCNNETCNRMEICLANELKIDESQFTIVNFTLRQVPASNVVFAAPTIWHDAFNVFCCKQCASTTNEYSPSRVTQGSIIKDDTYHQAKKDTFSTPLPVAQELRDTSPKYWSKDSAGPAEQAVAAKYSNNSINSYNNNNNASHSINNVSVTDFTNISTNNNNNNSNSNIKLSSGSGNVPSRSGSPRAMNQAAGVPPPPLVGLNNNNDNDNNNDNNNNRNISATSRIAYDYIQAAMGNKEEIDEANEGYDQFNERFGKFSMDGGNEGIIDYGAMSVKSGVSSTFAPGAQKQHRSKANNYSMVSSVSNASFATVSETKQGPLPPDPQKSGSRSPRGGGPRRPPPGRPLPPSKPLPSPSPS